ncbi:MAG: hypothetical protein NTY27_07575 [Actinobacteria bacterium]|nr:hypothetical protein [Actinomycetota bacterium]
MLGFSKSFLAGQRHQFNGPTVLIVSSYFLYSFVLYSKIGFLNRDLIANQVTGDTVQQVWFLAWPTHALRAGLNPLWSSSLDVPFGINLLSNTSMPLLGILCAPVTWLFGAIATYGLLLQLALGASATSAYFVARKLTMSQLSAFVVGLLYGFSSFFLAQGHAHLFLTFAPIPPIVFWLLWRIVIQDGPVRKLAVSLGFLLVADFLISAERVVMMLFVAFIALVVAALFASSDQRRVAIVGLRQAFLPLVATAGILGVGPVLISLFGPWSVRGNPHHWTTLHHGDLMEFVQPNIWFRPIGNWHSTLHDQLLGASLERGFYVGIPLLLGVVYGAWRYRSLVVTRIATVLFLVTGTLSLGSSFWINGHNTKIPTPFAWVAHVPLLSAVVPPRYMLFVILIVAFGAGALLDATVRNWGRLTGTQRNVRRVGAGLFVLLQLWCFVPASRFAAHPVQISPWYHSDEFRTVVKPGSNVLFFPYPNPFFNHAMLIQADTEMRFDITGGQTIIGDGHGHNQGITMIEPWQVSTVFLRATWGVTADTSVSDLPGMSHLMPPHSEATVAAFHDYVRRYQITTIIATPFGMEYPQAVRYLIDAFGEPQVRDAGQVRFWKIAPQP